MVISNMKIIHLFSVHSFRISASQPIYFSDILYNL